VALLATTFVVGCSFNQPIYIILSKACEYAIKPIDTAFFLGQKNYILYLCSVPVFEKRTHPAQIQHLWHMTIFTLAVFAYFGGLPPT
jgi:hypothetical protein